VVTHFGNQQLNELVELELVKNDRKIRGYYRPDAPPARIALKSN
jgi:hypothetical protein